MSGISLYHRMVKILKKKCVSINSNCSEMHRNTKKITPYEWHFLLPQDAQNLKKKVCLNQLELL